jgi:hypothetical protein
MKVKILFAIILFFSTVTSAQKINYWKLHSFQINTGGVMSTKIPATAYGSYENLINESIYKPLSQYNINWSATKSLTNLRMSPICNANIEFHNDEKSANQRFGLSVNSRMLSSFLTHYDMVIYNTIDTIVFPTDNLTGDLRLNHVSPVLTLDYAYLKQMKVSKQLHFIFGVGAYAGLSLWNKVDVVASREYNDNGVVFNGGSLSVTDFHNTTWLSNFAKHNFNAGIYASFGLEYSLHDKQAENHRWFITYENRICYDFFAVKNVPSSWFSFQSANMFGLKYYLNRK